MTLRPHYEDLTPSAWTPEEAEHHLRGTFAMACKGWPDIMEPYMTRMKGAEDPVAHMRRALRETVQQRYAPVRISEAAE